MCVDFSDQSTAPCVYHCLVLLHFALWETDKYGFGARTTKFNGDSLGTGEGGRKSLRNISGRTLSPGGNGADVLVWTLLGAHSVQYFAETQIYHLLMYII